MAEAADILRELPGAVEGRSWNLAIRRAQEVVELVLKALLAEMGIDYPKIHDVAPHFVNVVRARGLHVEEATLTWVEMLSARLAARRAPAFYFEVEYDEAEAREAVSAAEQVMAFGRGLIKQLRAG